MTFYTSHLDPPIGVYVMYQLWEVGGWDGRNVWAIGAAHRMKARLIGNFELIKRPSQCICEPRQCRQVGSGGMRGTA